MSQTSLKIILATDFTEAAENAIDYCLQLFSNHPEIKASYTLLHAYKPLVPYSNTPAVPVIEDESLEKELKKKLDETASDLGKRVDVKSYFKKGAVNEVLNELMEEENPDLIVMGSRKKSAVERMTFGSNTIEVAGTINCPVLAVPREAEFREPENVVFATDLKPLDISYDSLALLKQITSDKSKLNVVHVYPDGSEEDLKNEMQDSALKRYLSETDHSYRPIISSDIYQGIASFIEKHKPSLVAVIPRDRNFFEKLFHTSVTEKMIYHTQTPILILV